MTEVGDNQSLVASLKQSSYYNMFKDEASGLGGEEGTGALLCRRDGQRHCAPRSPVCPQHLVRRRFRPSHHPASCPSTPACSAAPQVSSWENKLSFLQEGLQLLNQIQRKWVYLEPIFARGALPSQQQRFRNVDEEFRRVMTSLESTKKASRGGRWGDGRERPGRERPACTALLGVWWATCGCGARSCCRAGRCLHGPPPPPPPAAGGHLCRHPRHPRQATADGTAAGRVPARAGGFSRGETLAVPALLLPGCARRKGAGRRGRREAGRPGRGGLAGVAWVAWRAAEGRGPHVSATRVGHT
jgi:hypothetical protein